MNSTKRLIACSVFLSTLASIAPVNADTEGVFQGKEVVSDGTGKQVVTYIRVNPKDPNIVIQPSIAGNHFGSTATLASLVQAKRGIAGINGTFFDSYSDQMPQGTLMVNGVFQHIASQTTLLIEKNGSLTMTRIQISLLYTATNNKGVPLGIYPWAVNERGTNPQEIYILTSFWGNMINITDATAVVVQNNTITAIKKENTEIPKNGYVLVFNNSPYNSMLLSHLNVGESVTATIKTINKINNQSIDTNLIESEIGSGPLLLYNRKIVLNPSVEHLNSTTLINAVGCRSLLGIDEEGNLIMARVSHANLAQLARIAYNMHLVDAMNLDGGASSGLYYDSKYLWQPGRPLSNALVVSVKH